jgi:hypothetical protein
MQGSKTSQASWKSRPCSASAPAFAPVALPMDCACTRLCGCMDPCACTRTPVHCRASNQHPPACMSTSPRCIHQDHTCRKCHLVLQTVCILHWLALAPSDQSPPPQPSASFSVPCDLPAPIAHPGLPLCGWLDTSGAPRAALSLPPFLGTRGIPGSPCSHTRDRTLTRAL